MTTSAHYLSHHFESIPHVRIGQSRQIQQLLDVPRDLAVGRGAPKCILSRSSRA
jgi:hypothetical protein